MLRSRSSLMLCVMLGFSACATAPASSPTSSAATDNSTQQAGAPLASPTAKPANPIRTEPFEPSPIQIDITRLPAPYSSQSVSKSPQVSPIPADPVLNAPAGFEVNVFAENLDRPRWLALTPDGNVLVTETRENRIRLLKDTNGDGAADDIQTFASADNGLNIPFGMSFAEDYFFLGNTDAVLRLPYSPGQNNLRGQGEKIADLPGGGYNQHWTRNVITAPDGQSLYVSVGSRSNADEEELPRASVQTMGLDGSNAKIIASGLRNPVGLAVHPQSEELYTTVNERDGLGDDLVPDYFTRIQDGEFYGWPYAYLTPNLLDPRHVVGDRSRNPDLAAQTKTPDVLFQAHSAALGLQFYAGNTFPERYRNGAFVAMRGSWNRSQGTGYKIVFIPFDKDNRPTGYYEDFITGFLIEPTVPTTWERPVGLLVLPDGSVLFTEEMNGRIYHVQYRG